MNIKDQMEQSIRAREKPDPPAFKPSDPRARMIVNMGNVNEIKLGAQEPPNNPIIFNRRQPDGSFRPISEFFEGKKKLTFELDEEEKERMESEKEKDHSDRRFGAQMPNCWQR